MGRKELERAEKIIITYLNNKAFTACALGFSRLEEGEFRRQNGYWGKRGRQKDDPFVDRDSLFDLASLTKPLFTLLSILCLIREKKTSWNERLESLLSNHSVPRDKKEITLRQLVSHYSGLPAHKEYYKRRPEGDGVLEHDRIVEWILEEPLEQRPGDRYVYSDLDYIILGKIIENISGEGMATYWRSRIGRRLSLNHHFYIAGEKQEDGHSFVSTSCDPGAGSNASAVVHDHNCRATGTILGHAGLFSTLDGVAALCECLMDSLRENSDNSCLDRRTLFSLFDTEAAGRWAHGFDVVTAKSSSGRYFSDKTIGHLGFTGTSFWIDLQRNLSVVLLTNRVVYEDTHEAIRRMRPLVHNGVLEEYLV